MRADQDLLEFTLAAARAAGCVLLEPLAVDGRDALVLYNLGLIAQRRGTYNPARSRYLAALKADPSYAPARYNLALLTGDAGIKEEAQHHALKFIELSPGDPRGAELRTRVGLDLQPAPAGPMLPGTVSPEPAPAPKPAVKPTKAEDDGLKNPFGKR